MDSQLDFQPVIIIGAARSGTNMLRDALTSFDGVTTWPCDEINAIWRHRRSTTKSDEMSAADATYDVRRFVRTAFRKRASRTAARYVVEKTCANSLRVDFVRSILPESKFVFLIRDGRAVVASAMKRWHGKLDIQYTVQKARYVPAADAARHALHFTRNRLTRALSKRAQLRTWGPRFAGMDELLATRSLAEVCAAQWSCCVLQAAASLSKLPPQQVCHVRYESLVERPIEVLKRITEFLAISTTSEMLTSTAGSISTGSITKWRSELSSHELSRIGAVIDHTWQSFARVAPQWADESRAAA